MVLDNLKNQFKSYFIGKYQIYLYSYKRQKQRYVPK